MTRQLVADSESGVVRVVRGGQTLATVLPMAAWDAAGDAVATSVSVEGDVLTVSVADAPGTVRFPVAVDPTVVDKEAKLAEGAERGNWAFSTTNKSAFYPSISANTLIDQDNSGSKFSSAQNGFFAYTTQGESRIYELGGELVEDNPGESAPIRNELLLRNSSGEPEKKESFTPHTGETHVSGAKVCFESGCGPVSVSGSPGNTAIFLQNAIGEGSFVSAKLVAPSVYIEQEKGPSVSFDTTDSTIDGRPNPLLSGNWVSTKTGALAYVGLEASDPGVGVEAQSLSAPSKPGWSASESRTSQNACEGVQCDESIKALAVAMGGHGELPEGEDTIEGKVEDAVGLSAKASAKVHIDNVPPHSITISGLPRAGAKLEEGYAITEAAYHFSVSATDGSGSESAGVESIAIRVDGVPLGYPPADAHRALARRLGIGRSMDGAMVMGRTR